MLERNFNLFFMLFSCVTFYQRSFFISCECFSPRSLGWLCIMFMDVLHGKKVRQLNIVALPVTMMCRHFQTMHNGYHPTFLPFCHSSSLYETFYVSPNSCSCAHVKRDTPQSTEHHRIAIVLFDHTSVAQLSLSNVVTSDTVPH